MPTGYIPVFEIFKGGENVTPRFQDRALAINVQLSAGSGDQDTCDILLDDRGWQIASPNIGDRLEIRLGYQDIGTAFLGSFEIGKIIYRFPAKQIVVIGTAASSLSDLKTRKTQSFDGKTVEQVLAEAGREIGMKVDVHPSIADEKIPFLNTDTRSVQGLIARLEKQYGAVAKIMDGRIALVPRGEGRSVSDISLPTYVLRPENFAEAEVCVDSASAYAKTTATWRDLTTHTLKTEESKSTIQDNPSSATYSIGREFPSQAEAAAAAKATQSQLDRATGKLQARLAAGDPWFRDAQRIIVAEAREGIDGSYLTDVVRHHYSKDTGITTTFSASAGTEGLDERYAQGGEPGEFLSLDPGQLYFGQALQQRSGTTLEQPFGTVPSFTQASPPSIP